MTAMKPYVKQGRRARLAGVSRDACPFKRQDLVVDWVTGWDDVDREVAEEQRQAASPRWEGDYRTRRVDASGSSWTLRGDAPYIRVHGEGSFQGEPSPAAFEAIRWGIDRAPLPAGTESTPMELQRAAIQAVRQVLIERLAELDAIADETGALRVPADDDQDGAK